MYAVPLHQCQPAEVKWQDSNLNVVADLPREVRRWLLDSGSLTAHLRRESTGHFHVEVLSQHWGLP
ncbi:MAG: chorismate lyase, partial [Spongiibacteraceae bacterium]